jgi:hypothetical protein
MGLDFRIRDFAYPIAIFNKKKQFDKNQYLSLEALEQYQFYRLREIISHAYAKVPYYKKSFDSLGIRPSDILPSQILLSCLFFQRTFLKILSLISGHVIQNDSNRWNYTQAELLEAR